MILRLGAVALCGVTAYALLRQWKPELAPLTELAAGAVILLTAAGELRGVREALDGLFAAANTDASFAETLFRVVGAALVTGFAADTARDGGMTALAGKIEFAGRVLMLGLALPVFRAAAQMLAGMIDGAW